MFNLNYDLLKKYTDSKQYPNLITAYQDTFLEFNFDYKNFKKNMINSIFKDKNPSTISYEDYMNIFYYNFFSNWKDLDFINSQENFDTKYLVNKLPNDIESIEFVINETKDSKIVFVERNLIGIMKSRTLEHIKKRKLDIKNFDNHFYSIAKTDFFNKAISYSNKVKKLKSNYQDRIYITNLDDLVYKTKNEMEKISNFCGINYEEILSKKTHLSKIIENQTNKINDDEYTISKRSKIFANLMMWNKSYLKDVKKTEYLKYLKQIILTIYLKLKYLFQKFNLNK